MSKTFDIQTFSIATASASIVLAAVYYLLQLRHQGRIRQTDLIMKLYSTFSSREFQDAWTKVRSTDLNDVNDIYDLDQKRLSLVEVNQVCLFFEGIGILLQRKLADTTMIEDLFGGAIARAWEKVRTPVIKARQQLHDLSIYWYFEYLYNEMQKATKPANNESQLTATKKQKFQS